MSPDGFEILPRESMPEVPRGRRMRLAMMELKKAGIGNAARVPAGRAKLKDLQAQAYRTAKRIGITIITHMESGFLWVEITGVCGEPRPIHLNRSRAAVAMNILRSLGK